jgi:hypothetical protein
MLCGDRFSAARAGRQELVDRKFCDIQLMTVVMDSGLDASHRPGMTRDFVSRERGCLPPPSCPRRRASITPGFLGSSISVSGMLGRPVKPGDDDRARVAARPQTDLPVVPMCRTPLTLRCRANHHDNPARPAATRGAARDRHGRWLAGCDGREVLERNHVRGRALLRGRRNRVVLAPRRWRQIGGTVR